MDEDRFWAIIQRCHDAFPADMERKGELVRQEIARLSKSEAASFYELYDEAMDVAYSWELWGAAYVIGDHFLLFLSGPTGWRICCRHSIRDLPRSSVEEVKFADGLVLPGSALSSPKFAHDLLV